MAVLDTLEILIEADSSGLTTQLSKATDTIVQFVNKMNTQEVDWTSILSKTISPAIITGIASMFANAIVQYTQFQSAATNLNNVSGAATDDLGDSINQLGGQVYTLAEQSGASLGDTTEAFEAFSKAGLDAAAATSATSDAAGIARATGESMATVVAELVPLFQAWGVTTLPQVTAALTGLSNAAGAGQFSFDELVQTITTQGANLSSKTNISDVAIDLASLSNQSGLTKTAIVDDFNAIATGAASPLSQMSLLVGNVSQAISNGPDGLITAFQMVQAKLNDYGPAIRQTIGQTIGLSTSDVSAFGNTSTAAFDNTATAADNLRAHLIDLNTLLETHTSTVSKLGAAWNTFTDYLAAFTVPPGIALLTAALDEMNSAFKSISQLVNGTSTDKVGDWLQAAGVTSGVLGGAAGGAAIGAGVGSFAGPVGTLVGGGVGAVGGGIAASGLLSSIQDAITSGLGSGTGGELFNELLQKNSSFTSGQVSSINSAGTKDNDIQQLLTALTSGLNTNSASYAQLHNTFNITAPQGATSITAQQIAAQLYKQFASGS